MKDELFEKYLAELPSFYAPWSDKDRFFRYHAYLQGRIDGSNETHDQATRARIEEATAISTHEEKANGN